MTVSVERRPSAILEPDEHVLVVTPQTEIRVGDTTLPSLDREGARVNDALVTAATASEGTARISVFVCSRPDAPGSWGLATDLAGSRVPAVAARLCAEQLLVFRRLFAAGVGMHVRLSLGTVEQLALRRAQAELRGRRESALGSATGPQREVIALDVWLLRNFVFQFDLPLCVLLESTLGANRYAVTAKMRAAQRRRSTLSPEAIGLLSSDVGLGLADATADTCASA